MKSDINEKLKLNNYKHVNKIDYSNWYNVNNFNAKDKLFYRYKNMAFGEKAIKCIFPD
jgi:hypothetical protein